LFSSDIIPDGLFDFGAFTTEGYSEYSSLDYGRRVRKAGLL